jgi:hypothetical protein
MMSSLASNGAGAINAPPAERWICPKCGVPMKDCRKDKLSPRAADFRCGNKACRHYIWPGQPLPAVEPAPPARRKRRVWRIEPFGVADRRLRAATEFVLTVIKPRCEESGVLLGDVAIATLIVGATGGVQMARTRSSDAQLRRPRRTQ